MDLVLTILFYLSAILAVAGALASALLPAGLRGLAALLAVAVGTAGVLVSLSAGFAALVALVSLGAAALVLGREPAAGAPVDQRTLPAQIGAVAAGLLVLALVYVALRGTFAAAPVTGDGFGLAALGRVLFGRDALAMEAVGAMLLIALAFGAVVLGRRS